MTNETEVKELICQLFLGGDTGFPIEPETDLLAEGICDSLSLVRLAAELEGRVPGLRIADQDITRENMSSIAAIVSFLRRKANQS